MDNNECIVTFLSVEGLKSLCGLFQECIEGIVFLRGHFHSYPQSLQVPQDHNLLKYKDDVLRPCLPSNLFSVNSSDLAGASEKFCGGELHFVFPKANVSWIPGLTKNPDSGIMTHPANLVPQKKT